MEPLDLPPDPFSGHIDQVRRFERFYRFHLGRLERLVASEDFTAADMRVIHELGMVEGGGCGSWLAYRLDLDRGHVSRVLGKLEAYGLVEGRDSEVDGRMRHWDLTKQGRSFARTIESAYRDWAQDALFTLPSEERKRLVEAMATIERILSPRALRRLLGVRPKLRHA